MKIKDLLLAACSAITLMINLSAGEITVADAAADWDAGSGTGKIPPQGFRNWSFGYYQKTDRPESFTLSKDKGNSYWGDGNFSYGAIKGKSLTWSTAKAKYNVVRRWTVPEDGSYTIYLKNARHVLRINGKEVSWSRKLDIYAEGKLKKTFLIPGLKESNYSLSLVLKKGSAVDFAAQSWGGSLVLNIVIARDNSKTVEYTIVHPKEMTDGDRFVLNELQTHLKKASGRNFIAVSVDQAKPDGRHIFLGIPPKGFDAKTLKDQEHCVMTRGKDLYLFGGGANGTRYAVFDFLQNVLGFRFFDARGGIKIPDLKNTLEFPEVNRRITFSFPIRRTTMYWLFNHPQSIYFLYRNGQNNWVEPVFAQYGIKSTPDDYFHFYPMAHTLRLYVPLNEKSETYGWIRKLKMNLWKDHPEYFSLNAVGKRVSNMQVCFSNKDLRKLLAERILKNMERNPKRHSFDVTANDVPGKFCFCKGCLALEKKYRTEAGPLIDFLLEFCPIAAEKYPGKWITALAYRKNQSEKPPAGIEKMPDNFVPVFAPIDDNFAQDWNHPDNRETFENLKRWKKLCRNVLIWYYPGSYGQTIPFPQGSIERFANDIRLAKKVGITGFVCEHDVGVPEMVGFSELLSYVGLQLFQDCDKPLDVLIREFTDFEYGPAAPLMRKYLDELENLRKKGKVFREWNASPAKYQYLTPENLVRWNNYFNEMEKLTANSPELRFNVQRVRICLDYAMLQKYALIRKYQPDLKLSLDELKKRIDTVFKKSTDRFYASAFTGRKNTKQKNLENSLLVLSIQNAVDSKPLPKDIFGKYPQDSIFVTIPRVSGKLFVKDPEAAFGQSSVYTDKPQLPFRADFENFHGKYSYRTGIRYVKKEDLGPRGQYKFYDCGKIILTPNCSFRMGTGTWWDFKTALNNAYIAGSFGNAIVYASLKFEGPLYYKEDAGKQNKVYCDRVVVVRLD